MTGSVALDVVIGLVFIYLLYSLLASVICEIIASYLGLRARNLQQAIRRMLEDNPQASEVKLLAFARHIWEGIKQIVRISEGPAACVFYHLPIIKYMGRNTLYSKPSYITKQNFSKAVMEIFRRYGGDESKPDLEKIQNVLKGNLAYPQVLQKIKNEINNSQKVDPEHLDSKIDYSKIRKTVEEIIETSDDQSTLDLPQKRFLSKINELLESNRSEKKDKEIVFKIDELLNLFGHETRSHLQSLLKDANNDLSKFRLLMEQWFDDTMDRASGWYKQKIQFVLLIIGLVLAVCLNANTVVIVKKLSVDKDARDKLVQIASDYIKDPNNKPTNAKADAKQDTFKIDSVRRARLDSLEKVRVKLQADVDQANSLLGMGWIDLPDSIKLINKDALNKLLEKKNELKYASIAIENNDVYFFIYPPSISSAILWSLNESSWPGQKNVYTGFNSNTCKIKVDNSWWGHVLYVLGNLFSSAFWGYLLTAIAISMGAPFWFDLLSKLVQIRGSVKQSTSTQEGESAVSNPAHPLNVKG